MFNHFTTSLQGLDMIEIPFSLRRNLRYVTNGGKQLSLWHTSQMQSWPTSWALQTTRINMCTLTVSSDTKLIVMFPLLHLINKETAIVKHMRWTCLLKFSRFYLPEFYLLPKTTWHAHTAFLQHINYLL